MLCSRCGSSNIKIQAVSELRKKRKSIFYWLLIGWWFELIMWIFLTLPWLIVKIFKPKNYKTRTNSIAVCQSCGKNWKV